MSYRVTPCEALQANLSAAGNTLILCRANIGRIPMSNENKADTLWPVFIKVVVRRFHATSLISGTLVSRSGLSQTGPAGCQLRVWPDQRSGCCARACA